MPMQSDDAFVAKLMKVLGLPKRTKAFCLRAEMDKSLEVDCTYYPDPKDNETVLTERFTLKRIEDQEQP